MVQNTAQNITTGAWVAATGLSSANGDGYDIGGVANNGSSQAVLPVSGLWRISAHVFTADSTPIFSSTIFINGVQQLGEWVHTESSIASWDMNVTRNLAEGAIVQLAFSTSNGGTVQVFGPAIYQIGWLELFYLGTAQT
jgi:hypothetical protein